MQTYLTDTQTIAEAPAAAFSFVQATPYTCQISLTNIGINTITYDFQYFNTSTNAWVDFVPYGDPSNLNATLPVNSSVVVTVNSPSYPKVQLIASADGGSILSFGVSRLYNRPSGGALPLLSF